MPKIKVNGINLYYETYGTGEPVVFVSGFSGDHTAFQNIVDIYSKQYQVVLFDNRGIGQSDCPDYPYTTEMMADDTAGLVKALNLEPSHFLGHSFGGCIVQNIAYKYPELTKSVILSSTFSRTNMRGNLYADARLELIKAGAPESAIIKFITLLCWSEKYLNKPGMVKKLTSQGFYTISITGYEGQLNASKTFDSTKWLNKIKCPCLVIVGNDDIWTSIEDGQNMCKAIPNAKFYCFKDVGHVPHVEQPEIFNKLVLGFIGKHDK